MCDISMRFTVTACAAALICGGSFAADDGPTIPFIDLRGWNGLLADRYSRVETAKEWREALESVGFAAITNHGLPRPVRDALASSAKKFFNQSKEEKLACSTSQRYGGGGYTAMGQEAVTRTLSAGESPPADLVESFVFLPATIAAAPSVASKDYTVAELEAMSDEELDAIDAADESEPGGAQKELLEDARVYWKHMENLVQVLHGLSAHALGVWPNVLEDLYQPAPAYALRLAHYPPIQNEQTCADGHAAGSAGDSAGAKPGECEMAAEGRMRYGAHTDYQGLTVLFPDPDQPGLEVLFPDGKWRSVFEGVAEQNALVVNIGDLWQRMTNDKWKSTVCCYLTVTRRVCVEGGRLLCFVTKTCFCLPYLPRLFCTSLF